MPKHKLEMRFTYLIDTDDMRSVLEKMEFPSFDLDDSSQEFLDSSYSWEEVNEGEEESRNCQCGLCGCGAIAQYGCLCAYCDRAHPDYHQHDCEECA